jgi:hypothetical protein
MFFSLGCIVDAVGSRLSLRAVVPNVLQPGVFMLVWGNSLQCYGVIPGFLSW